MIAETVQVATSSNAHDALGGWLLGTTGGSFVLAVTIAQVNLYLQAGAFVVSMIAGLCAAYYYIRKANHKDPK